MKSFKFPPIAHEKKYQRHSSLRDREVNATRCPSDNVNRLPVGRLGRVVRAKGDDIVRRIRVTSECRVTGDLLSCKHSDCPSGMEENCTYYRVEGVRSGLAIQFAACQKDGGWKPVLSAGGTSR